MSESDLIKETLTSAETQHEDTIIENSSGNSISHAPSVFDSSADLEVIQCTKTLLECIRLRDFEGYRLVKVIH